ncbi:lytic transglycosylase domain-containing protein [Arthrobacter bambusae]|uniref:aggregation-promoting factor C-terminal-like domain-containing protein n=1 Tax=Arthrobacter bambusae TaxID=1338426 RepID=UPI00277EF249|nr:lytic transglycosylase domain-containing protein [Arthrobacter bambusae]MDQ0028944.1 ABC-type transporter Mla subunit MlaD [Arthrobacter bambusae]MDQ0098654.1 ABC-type transporter Mla subunit MlaD [Arthrobacter bambusae]
MNPLSLSAIIVPLLAASLLQAGPASADDGPPSGYPSWAEVQQAQGNEAAASAEVDRINQLLASLQQKSGELGAAAIKAGTEYAKAHDALQDQQAVTQKLAEASQQAKAKADSLKKATSSLVVKAYESGGFDPGPWSVANAAIAPDNIQSFALLNRVLDRTAKLHADALSASQASAAATAQEQAARDVLAQLDSDAAAKAQAAESARRAAEDSVAATDGQRKTMVAQLASLTSTSAAVAQKYQEGQAALAAYQAAQEAKREAAERQAEADAQAAANQRALQAQQQPVGSGGGASSSGSSGGGGIIAGGGGGGGANVVDDPAGARQYASSRLGAYGWGQDQMQCLSLLWTQESSWMTDATNPSSGAYGVAQALPPDKYYSAGSDWLSNYRTQIDWGLGYIRDRYGSPCNAWQHEMGFNWY